MTLRVPMRRRVVERSSAAFVSLSIYNYRLYFFGQLISVSGTWMQTAAQSFLVLQLTGSGTALGLSMAARFAPVLLLGQWGGLIADRLDRRRVLVVTQILSGLTALAFGVLVSSGAINLGIVYLLAAVLGLVNVFDNPARQSLVSDLVPSTHVANAVMLNSTSVNLARMLGSAAGGGIAATVGLALCFDVNALSYVAVLVSLLLMRPEAISDQGRLVREPGQIRAGLRHVARTRQLLIPLVMTAVVGTFAWEFPVSLPLIADKTFGGGVGTYGTMAAVMGAGAVIGGLLSAGRPNISPVALASAAVGWGVSLLLAGLAPWLWTELVALFFVGFGSIAFNAVAKTSLQLMAEPAMRGRVMALWGLAWLGTTPIGGPIVGWCGQHLGARWALLIGAIPTILVGAAAYLPLRREDRADSMSPGLLPR